MTAPNLRKRTDVLTVREFDGEFVLLDSASNRIHQFNRTASQIWRLCDRASPESIAGALVREYDVDEQQALNDVVRTLDAFRSLKLVA